MVLRVVVLVLVLVLCSSVWLAKSQSIGPNVPRVCIEDGCMRGSWMRSLHGERFEAFFGIPYAKPPVSALRFANPVPNDPWPEVDLDASGKIPKAPCLQQNLFVPERGVEGKEDCLYLNVHRPVRSKNSSTESLPTLVYIHGGGYLAGYNSPLVAGAEKLMDHPVILVTIAYRLGAFGFLSTGDEAASGNYGLKDQRLALRWVHKNIKAFGGDPELVTIMGQSAGGASVHLQLMDRKNEGLFQQAISLSGNALAPWSSPRPNPEELARRQAQLVGIKDSHRMNTSELVRAMREVDAELFVSSYKELTNGSRYLVLVYGPVVEPSSVEDAFLTETPQELWSKGDYLSVPWLTGVVPNDGFIFSASTLQDTDCNKETVIQHTTQLLNVLGAKRHSYVLPLLMERFFGNQTTNDECFWKGNVNTLTTVFNEALFLYPLTLSIRQHTKHTLPKSPVFLYNFNYKGQYSYSSVFAPEGYKAQDYGVVHCDELIYLFRAPVLFPDIRRNTPDALVTRKFTDLIVQFARTGVVPGAADSDLSAAELPQALELVNSNNTDEPLQQKYVNFYDDYMFQFWTRFYSN